MEIKEFHANASFKLLSVSLLKGEEMPQHFASSEAFLVIGKGKGLLHIQGEEILLEAGSTLLIPAKEPHSLHILEDFAATVVLAAGAQINFINSQKAASEALPKPNKEGDITSRNGVEPEAGA